MSNVSVFEAFVNYCCSPKHTVDEQLLEVQHDKRELSAFMAVQKAASEVAPDEDAREVQEKGEGNDPSEEDVDEDDERAMKIQANWHAEEQSIGGSRD